LRVTGNSALGVLFDVYQEVKIYPDDEDRDSSDAVTKLRMKAIQTAIATRRKKVVPKGDGGSSGGGNVGEQSSPSGPTSTSTSTSVIAPAWFCKKFVRLSNGW
jgi:hypothetical protein